MKILLLILSLLSASLTYSQCPSVWQELNGDYYAIGPVLKASDWCLPISQRMPVHIDFDGLVKQIKWPIEDSLNQSIFRNRMDSLSNLGSAEAWEEAKDIQARLNSTEQSIIADSIEYESYNVDTFRYLHSTIPIYRFSTTFTKDWNIDDGNCEFYYVQALGVLLITSYDNDGDLHLYSLIKNCHITKENDLLKEQLLVYIITRRRG